MPSAWVYAVVVAIVYAFGFGSGWAVEGWHKDAEISQMKAASVKADKAAAEAARAAEKHSTLITEQLEMTNEAATKTVEAQATENRRLVRELGGLRDPGTHFATPGVSVTYPPPGGAPAGPTPCKLSDELEEFLQAEAARADAAAVYAQTGHGYAVEMTK